MQTRHPAFSLAAGAFMISFAAPLVRLVDVTPTVSAFYRVLFGALILLIWLLARGKFSAFRWQGWPGSILIGAFFALDLWLWHRSIVWVSPGIATLLANLQVLVMAAIGILVFREPAGIRFGLGLTTAVTGLWLLLGQDWQSLPARYQLGVLFGVLTALAYAAYLLTLRGYQQGRAGLDSTERMFQVSIACTVILFASSLLEGHSLVIPDWNNFNLLLLNGLLCQVLGWVLISRGLPLLAASVVGFLLLLQPSLSILWDRLFFGLAANPSQWLGMLMVLAGIYLGSTIRANRQP